ncbi:type-F conjugative transfer system pilin assembly protein TraF [Photobacterium damselae]|uniref:IncF plasmid conjugative transfer pilus assembly protein TraF n=2 Tax=Photobacterium damselae TaxID=38293 RepID=D0Z536_PHODD|nr:type-F conjugative transfer system pilin assembly protein TraF [Photobacterium damselae]EEZ39253.1 IncF plasmid conjugative transfer pilus assembly protein TraF [Photobacterium damselae subsp. damselae CIP 102761]PSW80318.1 type-F conjugative transfer system pilin assembly protein TraF [Photobacterium damselae]SPY45171.1 conjugal pilus assembly protein TraF [Photobacterium damselae]
MIRTTLLIPLLLISTNLHADNTAQGWRWYNEPRPAVIKPKPITPKRPTATVTTTPPPRTLSATEQMNWFHGYFNEIKNKAVIDPSLANVLDIMRLNHYIDGKTTDFGMTWKQALVTDPSLSYRLKHPTESLARQTQNAQVNAIKANAVRTLAHDGYGLFFVYKGDEPLNKQLAPSIQAFADEYGIELLGVSLDGKKLPSIRHNRLNKGKLKVEAEPALLLVNPNTNTIKPLAYGFISQEELLGRFLNAATNFAPDF